MMNKQLEFKGLYKCSRKVGPVVTWILFLLGIMIASVLSAFFPVYFNIVFMVLLPILVLIYLKLVMFERLKLSTLICLRFLIILPALGVFDGHIFVQMILAFLIINIMEATFTDLLKNKMYFNFVSGLAVGLSVLLFSGSWIKVGMPEGAFSFIYRADLATQSTATGVFPAISNPTTAGAIGTILWAIAYTIWNWNFVIGEFSDQVAKLHLAILFAPLILSLCIAAGFGDWTLIGGAWLMTRALTLTSGGVFQIAAKKFVEDEFKDKKVSQFISKVKTKNAQIIIMLINLSLVLACVIIYFVA